MTIPNNLCPIYKYALGDMLVSLNFAEDDLEKVKILENFSEKFLMFPQFWNELIKLSRKVKKKSRSPYHAEVEIKARSHFYYVSKNSRNLVTSEVIRERHIGWNAFNSSRICFSKGYENSLKFYETAFNFPNQKISDMYKKYEKYGGKPISKEIKLKYQKSLDLLKRLENAGENDEEWLKVIQDLEDDEAVIANIELRLGNTVLSAVNKNIWKFYIHFLQVRSKQEVLNVYKRYTRLFISDKEMVEEYRMQIEKIGKLSIEVPNSLVKPPDSITTFWLDTIKFEMDFGTLESAYLTLERGMTAILGKPYKVARRPQEDFIKVFVNHKTIMQQIKPINNSINNNFNSNPFPQIHNLQNTQHHPTIHFSSCSGQRLTLPSTIISYLLKLSSISLLYRLNFLCKYFFALHPYPICHRLVVHPFVKTRCVEQSLFIKNDRLECLKLKKLYIGNSLECHPESTSGNIRDSLSKLISKLYKCEAKILTLLHQDITIKEFEFLIKSGKVKNVDFNDLQIFADNGYIFSVEEIKNMLEDYGNKLDSSNIQILQPTYFPNMIIINHDF